MVLSVAQRHVADPKLRNLLDHPLLLKSCRTFLDEASHAPVAAARKSVHVLQGEAAIFNLHVVRSSHSTQAATPLCSPLHESPDN